MWSKKHSNIYSVDEYIHTMSNCVRKPKNTVTTMNSRFYAMKGLPHLLGLKTTSYNSSGEKISFCDSVRWIRVNCFGQYQYRESLDDSLPWKVVNLLQCQTMAYGVKTSLVPLLKPQASIAINNIKRLDIQKQLPYVPETRQGLYRNLKATNNEHAGQEDGIQ